MELRQAGYSPSIADVVALHQHLTCQRNEAAFFAGALVIGPNSWPAKPRASRCRDGNRHARLQP